MIYSGIGSRKTPGPVLGTMQQIARWLAEQGHTLRSGGADGADTALENGCDAVNGKKEIFTADMPLEPWWFECAEFHHPAWNVCSPVAKKLHARNTPIILGKNYGEAPSDFILCWTTNGKPCGGTGQGLRIAKTFNIPVFNLYHDDAQQKLWAFLNGC